MEFELIGGLFDGWAQSVFNAIVSGIWQFVVYCMTWIKDALPNFLNLIVTSLPANLNANLIPYVNIIGAINQWVPLSEFVSFLLGDITWRIGWTAVKFILRVFTFGTLGRN